MGALLCGTGDLSGGCSAGQEIYGGVALRDRRFMGRLLCGRTGERGERREEGGGRREEGGGRRRGVSIRRDISKKFVLDGSIRRDIPKKFILDASIRRGIPKKFILDVHFTMGF